MNLLVAHTCRVFGICIPPSFLNQPQSVYIGAAFAGVHLYMVVCMTLYVGTHGAIGKCVVCLLSLKVSRF